MRQATVRSEPEKPADAIPRLGTFAGVFTPSILTILGIILFLRRTGRGLRGAAAAACR
jgi:hypothetical protein